MQDSSIRDQIKWKGPAWLCPKGHQKNPFKYNRAKDMGWKDTHCLGGCGWLFFEDYTYDEEIKSRTEGRKNYVNNGEINESEWE